MKTVPELLKEKIKVFEEKGKEYGQTYKRFGHIWDAIFPGGITIKGVDQANIVGIYHMLIHKIIRIAGKIESPKEISIDSARDIQVYAAMLEQLLLEVKEDCG
jgi:hypothetical protein